jgi:hypothetical protein
MVGDNKQVHGGNVRRVVTQKGAPSLTGRRPSFDHVLGDARLRNFKPELEQFAMNTRCSPRRIFDAHPPDQRAQVRLDLRPPSWRARLPAPIAEKADPVPTHERLGPDGKRCWANAAIGHAAAPPRSGMNPRRLIPKRTRIPKSEPTQLDCGPDPTSPALRASSASFVKIFFPAMRPDSQAPVI